MARASAVWDARSRVGFALCDLVRGEAQDAFLVILTAYAHGNRPEVKLVIALAAYEEGNKDVALGNFITASKSSDPVVRAALKTWWDGTGLSIEPAP